MDEKAKCPFYVRSLIGRSLVGVECEALMDEEHLGFAISHFHKMNNGRDLRDFVEVFCADMYETCPYYKAVMAIKYKEQV
jgi:hypothetical protein